MTTAWTAQDAMDMMRYGTVWRIRKLKRLGSGPDGTTYRCYIKRVRRRKERFYEDGPLQCVYWTTGVDLSAGDMIFRDNQKTGYTRLKITD